MAAEQTATGGSQQETLHLPHEETGSVGVQARRQLHPLVNTGVLVAVLGLVFTVGTYWVDQRSQERADERQARAALTDVTHELTSLTRSYAGPMAAATVSQRTELGSAMSSELEVLVAQAESIVSDTPTIVRAPDYFAIAVSHASLGNYDRAQQNYAKAEELSQGPTGDYVILLAARRGKGQTLFWLDRPDEASEEFELVVSTLHARGLPNSVVKSHEFFTLAFWARMAAGSGHCKYAAKPLSRLDTLTTSLNQQEAEDVAKFVKTACG